MQDIKLFSGSNSMYLAGQIAEHYGQELGDIVLNKFSDGEMQAEIKESVRGTFSFFIQSTNAPADNIMELLLMIDAAKRASADYITAVIPYFGYARQDRKDKARVPISAKLIANLLQAAGVNRIMTMDLHADQIQGFFDIPVDHLKSEAIFMPYLESLGLDNVTFACPDVGGVKRARTYAKYFQKDLVICDKYRKKANEVDSITVIGDVSGKHVLLVDDIVDTAGTLSKAADALIAKGASSVKAICTHPVLSGKAMDIITNSKLDEIIVSDTLPIAHNIQKIKVISSARLFARAIRNTHEHKSITALFVDKV
ncbi:MAG: ribose-phosphate pyrophosphokinase [Saprospiraceae bacterium]|nr:ribose-phosphate pyrophosphokinase [Saprospiraceae bacterium]HMW38007.1 ribose-phosphate pyrophosphokinase [Saprospiraceae bacterium]HMX86969.1 ribose-phosphate pyrophosphokinase [Saprospiraceae bacterium]HMZ39852.1 ribose-phosphate pyrophosphokinase [Saprospiraceae bacterium]HNA64692.1 ribose-phosphate pyrophosphokinase [Saprospiraceae bacterium]